MWRAARQVVLVAPLALCLFAAPVWAADEAPSAGDGAAQNAPGASGKESGAPDSRSRQENGEAFRSDRKNAPRQEESDRSLRPDGGCLYRGRELELIV